MKLWFWSKVCDFGGWLKYNAGMRHSHIIAKRNKKSRERRIA